MHASTKHPVQLPVLLKIGGVLGAAYGAWLVWQIGSFDGFSVGPPPPPTPEDLRRQFFLNSCLKAILFFGGTSLGVALGALTYGCVWLGRKTRGV